LSSLRKLQQAEKEKKETPEDWITRILEETEENKKKALQTFKRFYRLPAKGLTLRIYLAKIE